MAPRLNIPVPIVKETEKVCYIFGFLMQMVAQVSNHGFLCPAQEKAFRGLFKR